MMVDWEITGKAIFAGKCQCFTKQVLVLRIIIKIVIGGNTIVLDECKHWWRAE